jgi:hypothetical protein
MEQLRTAFTTLVGLAVILSLMAVFMIGIDKTACPTETCDTLAQRGAAQQPVPHADADKAPTLAPPRRTALSTATEGSTPSSQSGQAVYVQVKADRNDVEVGWASTDFLGR